MIMIILVFVYYHHQQFFYGLMGYGRHLKRRTRTLMQWFGCLAIVKQKRIEEVPFTFLSALV